MEAFLLLSRHWIRQTIILVLFLVYIYFISINVLTYANRYE
jgi:hypothetical protein